MATHDYNIANGSGIDVRSDLNAVLAAILSQNSSATEPTTTVDGMFWYDTTTSIFKQRNSTNTGWIDKWDTTKGMLATLYSPTFTGPVNLPTTTYVGGYGVATTQAPIFSGNSVFETLTAWSSVSLPASTTIGGVSATELSYLDGVTSAIQSQLNAKQATLVSGTNIKTINSTSLLGSGNIDIVANPSGVFANSQIFTASGTFTVPAGVTKVMVEGCGGGGGGGAASSSIGTYLATGGGGGGAESPLAIVNVISGSNVTVTVGGGGAGGIGANSSAPSGGNGGNSAFGSLVLLGGQGGQGVNTNTAIVYGRGGSKAGMGGDGGQAWKGTSSSKYSGGTGSFGGGGGGGAFGVGANGNASNTAGSSAGVNTGAGGSGASNTTTTSGKSGGNGGSGKVIVYW